MSASEDPVTGRGAASAGPAHIQLDDVSLAFGNRVVMHGLSCGFPRGAVGVVMGGSGSGKSTLLRLIAGLTTPDSGSVRVAGQEVVGQGERQLGAVRQRIGMLFQNGALLDSICVFDNVALPLRERSQLGEVEIRDEVHRRLGAVGLEDVDELLPGELSGGMLKRAALARAIVMDPEILLCDEPLSGLDPPNVVRIEQLLLELNRELGLTVLVTSHHVASSRRMADQLVLLMDGRAIAGTPRELALGRDARVRSFLGIDAESADAQRGVVGLA